MRRAFFIEFWFDLIFTFWGAVPDRRHLHPIHCRADGICHPNHKNTLAGDTRHRRRKNGLLGGAYHLRPGNCQVIHRGNPLRRRHPKSCRDCWWEHIFRVRLSVLWLGDIDHQARKSPLLHVICHLSQQSQTWIAPNWVECTMFIR